MAKAAEYGGKDPQKNLYMAERYGEAGGWLTTTLIGEGRLDEANRVGRDAGQVTEAVLQMRPGDFSALYSLGLIEGYLGAAAMEDLRPADSLPFYQRATEVYTTITRLDPGNRIYANNRASQFWDMSGALWSLGRTRDAQAALAVAVDSMKLAGTGGASLFLSCLRILQMHGEQYAEMGDFAQAAGCTRSSNSWSASSRARQPAEGLAGAFCHRAITVPGCARLRDCKATGRKRDAWRSRWSQKFTTCRRATACSTPGNSGSSLMEVNSRAEAQLALGDYKAAEHSAREGYAARKARRRKAPCPMALRWPRTRDSSPWRCWARSAMSRPARPSRPP